jgi:hypothetical protein
LRSSAKKFDPSIFSALGRWIRRGKRSAQIPPTSRKKTCWDRPGRENEAEVDLRAGQVEAGERECDIRERVPDERCHATEEEEAELALA